MFARTIHGDYHPVAAIDWLWGEKDESGERVGGAVHQLLGGEIRCVLDSVGHRCPAAPDTNVLQEVVDQVGRIALDKIPVLGLVFNTERGVLPVTIDGINHGLDHNAAVLMPSGEVVLAMNCTYSNEQCYFAEIRSPFKSS